MGKTLQYVKDFDFSSAGKPVGYCMGGKVKAATGGVMTKTASAKKGNTVASIGKQEAAVIKSRMMPEGSGMVKNSGSLGIKDNKNPGTRSKGVPVAPKQPMIAPYKTGGAVPKAGAHKMSKVMGEYKAGELHSGSKSGPVVKSRKQAVAIAMSEARQAAKKK